VGKFHSPVVDALWGMRLAESEADGQGGKDDNDAEPVPKPASASHTAMTYDFADNPMLGEHYRNPYGSVRIGRVLEDLDALAGTIAFKHTRPRAPKRLMLVTASVDRIELLQIAGTESNMVLSGSVAWVGRSSMVIRMTAFSDAIKRGKGGGGSGGGGTNGGGKGMPVPWLEADFTFVARDPATRKAAPINPLLLETEEERSVFGQIQAHVDRDRQSRNAPPCATVDQAHKRTLLEQAQAAMLMPALAHPGSVLMSSTRQHNVSANAAAAPRALATQRADGTRPPTHPLP
jgi:acyl-coenzyme A thioesterase 9